MPVAKLNAEGGIYDYSPMVNNDGTRVYWTSSRSDEYDVWSAEWNGAQWTAPTLAYVAAQRFERYFVPSSDDLALYFGSSSTGTGGYELRVVVRDTPTAMFDQPRLVPFPMIFTSATPAWLSDDRCRMYLAAQGDIWVATRVP